MECLLSVVIAALLWMCVCGIGNNTTLHFSYITTRTGVFVASGAIPVVDLALEQINNRTDILPNYTINYTNILDSQVMCKLISEATLYLTPTCSKVMYNK